jgi:hypothetical protein
MQQNQKHSQLIANGKLKAPQSLLHREMVGLAC